MIMPLDLEQRTEFCQIYTYLLRGLSPQAN
jgi:hypothetical protein